MYDHSQANGMIIFQRKMFNFVVAFKKILIDCVINICSFSTVYLSYLIKDTKLNILEKQETKI